MLLVSIQHFLDNFPGQVIIVWGENLYRQIYDLSRDTARCWAGYTWIQVEDRSLLRNQLFCLHKEMTTVRCLSLELPSEGSWHRKYSLFYRLSHIFENTGRKFWYFCILWRLTSAHIKLYIIIRAISLLVTLIWNQLARYFFDDLCRWRCVIVDILYIYPAFALPAPFIWVTLDCLDGLL